MTHWNVFLNMLLYKNIIIESEISKQVLKSIIEKTKIDYKNLKLEYLKKEIIKLKKDYEKGISCPKCVNKTSKDKKFRLKERNKQIEIAKKKGLYNPYIKYTPTDFS